jgi:pyridoxamine 5'-phosphate oxidase
MNEDQKILFHSAWNELQNGVANRRHGFHLAVVANSTSSGPDARTVVLREADLESRTLGFHSDIRSRKFENLSTGDNLIWVLHCPNLRLQVRARGTCTVIESGELWEQAWQNTILLSRRCYLAEVPPGKQVEEPTGGFPDYLKLREPNPDESEEGKKNFCIVATQITDIDIYSLNVSGHRRCHFSFTNEWNANWQVP